MGIIPPPRPAVPIYQEYAGDVITWVPNGGLVPNVGRFSLNYPTPGLFMVCIHLFLDARYARLGCSLTDTNGEAHLLQTAQEVYGYTFLVQVINNNWAVDSPLAGTNSVMFSGIGDALFSSSFSMLPDGEYSVSCWTTATSGNCTLQMFAYLAVPG
jgi:hypothetical protein